MSLIATRKLTLTLLYEKSVEIFNGCCRPIGAGQGLLHQHRALLGKPSIGRHFVTEALLRGCQPVQSRRFVLVLSYVQFTINANGIFATTTIKSRSPRLRRSHGPLLCAQHRRGGTSRSEWRRRTESVGRLWARASQVHPFGDTGMGARCSNPWASVMEITATGGLVASASTAAAGSQKRFRRLDHFFPARGFVMTRAQATVILAEMAHARVAGAASNPFPALLNSAVRQGQPEKTAGISFIVLPAGLHYKQ
jgi:hypothetical protein